MACLVFGQSGLSVDHVCGQSGWSPNQARGHRGLSGGLIRLLPQSQSGWSPDHARGQRGFSDVLAYLEKFYVGVCVGAGSVLGGPGLAQVRC